MLIDIHKEKRKQYWLQKLEKHQHEEIEQHEEYNPWAVEDKQNIKQIMKKDLGDAMNNPERALPRYCWRKPSLRNDGTGRLQIPPLPTHISKEKQQGSNKTRHSQNKPWRFPAGLLEPLY